MLPRPSSLPCSSLPSLSLSLIPPLPLLSPPTRAHSFPLIITVYSRFIPLVPCLVLLVFFVFVLLLPSASPSSSSSPSSASSLGSRNHLAWPATFIWVTNLVLFFLLLLLFLLFLLLFLLLPLLLVILLPPHFFLFLSLFPLHQNNLHFHPDLKTQS